MWQTLAFKLLSALLPTLVEIISAAIANFAKKNPGIADMTGLDKLLKIAEGEVFILANTDLTNEAKREEAVARVIEYGKKVGMVVSESLARWAVEAAVQKLKG